MTPEDGVWLDGEPVWVASPAGSGSAAPESESAAAVMDDDMSDDYGYDAADMSDDMGDGMDDGVDADMDADVDADMGDRDIAVEKADESTATDRADEQEGLTGGSIDDNEQFDEYLAYRERFQQLGIRIRDLDPSGRTVVAVTGRDGRPAAGAEVIVEGGGAEFSLRTTADGTIRFHPEAYEAGDGPFTVTVGERSVEVERGVSVALETDLPNARDGGVALDILFLLDVTGSMGDEIYQLKTTVAEVAQRIGDLPVDLDLRLGMTVYRDVGDTFVTANFNFTADVDHFTRALGVVVADGGGDYAEALDEALADALGRPTWRPAGQAVQLVFLIADAPPQIARQVPTPYTESMINAAGRGIKIFPVSSSGTDDQAEYVFRQLAQFTGGRYVFLTYGAGGRATGDATDIGERDYEELSLDDLIVRLVAEEVDALGQDPVTF